MSEVKYTPGPWVWDADESGIRLFSESGGRVIAEIDCHVDHKPHEITGNAKLIAAAPELLEALQWIMDYPPEDLIEWTSKSSNVTMTFPTGHIVKALNAIKKATE